MIGNQFLLVLGDDICLVRFHSIKRVVPEFGIISNFAKFRL